MKNSGLWGLALCGHPVSTASELESEGSRGFLFLTDRDSTAEFPKFWKLKGKKKSPLISGFQIIIFPFAIYICVLTDTHFCIIAVTGHTHTCAIFTQHVSVFPFAALMTAVFHVVTVV